MNYPLVAAVHWTAGPGDYTHSKGGDGLTWEDAWAFLVAAYEEHESICYCIEWTHGFGPRVYFGWMERPMWEAHGGHGPERLKAYCDAFAVPPWGEYDEAGDPL